MGNDDDEPTASPNTAPVHWCDKPKRLVPLSYYVHESWMPMCRCVGHCRDDSECKNGLICFQRETRNQTVPGCLGGEMDDTKWDFCTIAEPKPLNHLSMNVHQNLLPLGRCEGHCRNNGDCKPGLVCFQRETRNNQTVPGCIGGELDDTEADYCIRPEV